MALIRSPLEPLLFSLPAACARALEAQKRTLVGCATGVFSPRRFLAPPSGPRSLTACLRGSPHSKTRSQASAQPPVPTTSFMPTRIIRRSP